MTKVRHLHPGWIAGGIFLLVCLWLLSGTFAADTPADDETRVEARELPRVRVSLSHASERTREEVVSGRTAPSRGVELRAEAAGRVEVIATDRGTLVPQGAVLFQLDPADRESQIARARATLQQRKIQYEAAQRMQKQNLQSPVELATARANLALAEADVLSAEQALENITIRAPFDGLLDSREVEVGDYLSVGDTLGRFIQPRPALIKAQVSEDVVTYLSIGQSARARLPNGDEVHGILSHVAQQADDNTRTFPVELEVHDYAAPIIAGASAVLMLPLEQVQVHVVEPASLALSENGDFGIKSVDDSGHVVFHAATIEQASKNQIWLGDLPETLRIITLGQGYVAQGEEVQTIDAKDPS